MSLKEVLIKFIDLDPYEVVKCDLDSFEPYAYVEIPDSLKQEIESLSEEDREKFEDIAGEYIDLLQQGGVDFMKSELSEYIY